jgi:hypothetical protein
MAMGSLERTRWVQVEDEMWTIQVRVEGWGIKVMRIQMRLVEVWMVVMLIAIRVVIK